MMQKLFKVIVLLCVTFVSPFSLAAPSNAVQALVNALEKIQTYHVHFSQKIKDANGQAVSHTQGDMIIRRPGKFYWKSQAPDPVLVVADGTFLWTYDIELAQVTKQKMKEAIGNSPAALLSGSLQHINQDFNVSYAKKSRCQKGTDECFLLLPKQKDAAFVDIVIALSKGNVTEIRMRDPLGQDVHTIFSRIKVNQPIDSKVFSFVPPRGTDVIQGN